MIESVPLEVLITLRFAEHLRIYPCFGRYFCCRYRCHVRFVTLFRLRPFVRRVRSVALASRFVGPMAHNRALNRHGIVRSVGFRNS